MGQMPTCLSSCARRSDLLIMAISSSRTWCHPAVALATSFLRRGLQSRQKHSQLCATTHVRGQGPQCSCVTENGDDMVLSHSCCTRGHVDIIQGWAAKI